MIDAESWRRARRVFEEALKVEPARRPHLITEKCGGDEELAEAVENLLAADRETDELFGNQAAIDVMNALEEESERRWKGREFGAYRILSKLGEGGMGIVFLAERADREFEFQVALKLLRLGVDSARSRRRFLTERQLLAGLEHPNIARLIDGGTSSEGIPYLAMELVHGEPITGYCDRQQMSVRRRVELTCTLCEAVQHAHQNLIVHRDLKSSNVLVKEDGTLKLLDFGIAKLLSHSEGELAPDGTATEARAFTPDFASPEQRFGEPITTSSDVYSIGVLLHELLVGQRPFNWSGRTPVQIHRELTARQPSLPSRFISADSSSIARRRSTSPSALRRQLSGDLDNIALKALRREPRHRYATAQELADDLRRFLERRPVQARPSNLFYRTELFVRRHTLGVTTAALTFLGIVAFSIAMTVQAARVADERDRAQHQRDNAEIVSRLLVDAFELTSPDQARSDTISVREVLKKGAERLALDLGDQPKLRASLQHSIGSIYTRLGLFEEATPLLAAALADRRSRLGGDPALVADSWHAWATLQFSKRKLEEAEEAIRAELAIRRAEGDPGPLARAIHLQAKIAGSSGRREVKAVLHAEALEIQRQSLGGAHPDTISGMRSLAAARRLLGDYEGAAALGRQALAAQRLLHPGDHPATASVMHDLSKVLLRQREFESSEALARETLAMQLRLYGDIHPSRSATLNTLGTLKREREHYEEAEAFYRESRRIQMGIVGAGSPLLSSSAYNLATLLHRDLGRLEEAEPFYRSAVEHYRSGVGTGNVNLGYYLMGLGRILSDLDRPHEAEPVLLEAIAIFRQHASSAEMSRNEASASSALAGAKIRVGRYTEAEELLLKAHPILAEHYGETHRITLRAVRRLAALYRILGRQAEAASYEATLPPV